MDFKAVSFLSSTLSSKLAITGSKPISIFSTEEVKTIMKHYLVILVLYLLIKQSSIPPLPCRTQLGEDDEVLSVALGAGYARRTVAPLLLVHPALQTRLVHPLGEATATARTHPFGRAIVLVRGEAHPAAPAKQTGKSSSTHQPTRSNTSFVCFQPRPHH